MVRLDADRLGPLMTRALVARLVDAVAAGHVVDSLVQTSLRGVDSHGINLFPHYCRAVEHGRVNRHANIQISDTAPSTAIVDADHAFGHHAGAIAIDHARVRAVTTGAAAVAVRNSTHFGAAAYMALRAAAADCIGFAFTNADALVKAHNSTDTFFGTNPVCFAAPMETEGPFCLDMATSLANWNKVNNARRTNQSLPEDWAFDQDGQRVTDPHSARSLAPSGGYKGFGLGMLVDVLCGLLSSGAISKDIPAMYSSPIHQRRGITHFFMVLDISKFLDVTSFKHRLQEMAERVRALPRMAGADDVVMVAGDPEKRVAAERRVDGIPIDRERFDEFLQISSDFAEMRR